MPTPSFHAWRVAVVALSAIVGRPLAAQSDWIDACALIQPADVHALVGATAPEPGKPGPLAKALHGKRTWVEKSSTPGTSAIATLDVMVQTNPNDPTAFLNGMRTTAGLSNGNIVVKDEPSVGATAISELATRK